LIKEARQIHLYLWTFFAPAIIFYALTGALQSFQYHEEHEGRPAIPLFEKLAEIHKDQRVPKWSKPAAAPQEAQAEKPAIAQPNPAATASASPEMRVAATPGAQPDVAKPIPQTKPSGSPRAPRRKPSIPFKVFAVFMSLGLILSSCLGIYMAFKYNRDKRMVWALLLAGTVLPAVLLYL
jgi:hypothetical protein